LGGYFVQMDIGNKDHLALQGVYKGLTRKGLQSRSVIVSLLIKSYKSMKGGNEAYCCSGSEKQTHC